MVCTVVGGALLSGPTTARPAPAPAAEPMVVAAAIPAQADKLAELRGAERRLLSPPAPPAAGSPAAPPAAPPAAAPVPALVLTEVARRPRGGRHGAASRGGTARHRATRSRPRTSAPPNRPRTRNATRPALQTPARTGAGFAGAGGDGSVVGFAMAQVGKGYSFGSIGPDRFDCSGLVVAAYRRIGLNLPRSTRALAGRGRPVGRNELRPGDLVFPAAGHVGIYIGGGRIVHASTVRGGVKVSSVYAFRQARRVTG